MARRRHFVSAILSFLLLIGAGAYFYSQRSAHRPSRPCGPSTESAAVGKQLTIYAIDVGQGDSFLIITPARKVVLIDAGPPEASQKVIGFLKGLGVASLDLAVATHPHADHIGGMVDVLTAFPVRVFVDSGQPHPTRTYTRMLETAQERVQHFVIARAGQSFRLDSGILLRILGPSDPLLTHVAESEINANSVIAHLTFGRFRMLFTGDSETETEKRLLDSDQDISADVLKVAHHGSRYATTEPFLKAVGAEAAIISCGAENDYGHPAQKTLDRLRKAKVTLYRTDLQGDIAVTSDGQHFKVTPAHPPTRSIWAGRRPPRLPQRSSSGNRLPRGFPARSRG